MHTIVSVNSCNYGSTGNIAYGIAEKASSKGYKTYFFYPAANQQRPARANDIVICSNFAKKINQRLCRYLGLNGCFAWFFTMRMLRKITKTRPSLIHLHNLHNSYVNLPMLFRYIKKNNVPVVWTLHDCWAFTGHCPHFILARCDNWKTGCGHCPDFRQYPHLAFDNTKNMYKFKKKWFTGVKDMTIVTPSEWLADLAKQSFLKDYPVKVIHNGIDLSVFQPTDSDFRQKYGCEDKKLILGVAFGWGARKGLDVFVELAKRLPEDYQIVLVGTNETVDKQLPANIISIHRTQNQKELAEIYSAADLFVNPTREETYPTVNMESLACGTPVLTFRTGGSPEILDEACGSVVDVDDVDSLEKEICRICMEKPYSTEACLERARSFDMSDRFKEYVDLYENCSHSTKCSLQ